MTELFKPFNESLSHLRKSEDGDAGISSAFAEGDLATGVAPARGVGVTDAAGRDVARDGEDGLPATFPVTELATTGREIAGVVAGLLPLEPTVVQALLAIGAAVETYATDHKYKDDTEK